MIFKSGLNLYINLERIDIFIMLNLPVHKHHMSLHLFFIFLISILRFALYKSYGEGNGTPLQHSCLENPMDGGAWWAAVHGVAKSRIQLSIFTFTFYSDALEKEVATYSSGSCLENPRDRGVWWAVISGVAQSRTRLKRLSSSSSSTQVLYMLYIVS